jgi:hypothetical protein
MSLNLTTEGLLNLYISKRKEQKTLDTFVASLKEQVCKAIEMGELEQFETEGQYNLPGLVISTVNRKTFQYSPAVKELKEQEEFEGTATQRLTTSYSFKVLDD